MNEFLFEYGIVYILNHIVRMDLPTLAIKCQIRSKTEAVRIVKSEARVRIPVRLFTFAYVQVTLEKLLIHLFSPLRYGLYSWNCNWERSLLF